MASRLTEGASTRPARYIAVYSDLRRVHRSGIIACNYRLLSGATRGLLAPTAAAVPDKKTA